MKQIHQRIVQSAKENPSCFTHWFPEVQRQQIPHPRSSVIDFPEELTKAIINDEDTDEAASLMDTVVADIRFAGEQYGYPLFLKNSLFSGSCPTKPLLDQMSQRSADITERLGGYWSVDFLIDKDGNPFLIDMAEGQKSF